MYGVSLRAIADEHQARIDAQQKHPPKVRHTENIGELNIEITGTQYPVFGPGIDDPDDATTARWVP